MQLAPEDLASLAGRLELIAHAQIATSASMEHRAMAAKSQVMGANGQPQHFCMICSHPWPCKTYAHAMRWLVEQVAKLPLSEPGPTESPGMGTE